MNIFCLDLSLSSVGYCYAELNFDIEGCEDEYLGALLTEGNSDNKLHDLTPASHFNFNKYFKVIASGQLPQDKETKKTLAKIRKSKRENPANIEDNVEEEFYQMAQINNQVKSIVDLLAFLSSNTKRPRLILTEDYSYHSQGSLIQLAELKGVLKYRLYNICCEDTKKPKGTYYLNVPINSIKKITTCSGNANKEKMCADIERFGFGPFDPKKEDDECDAIGMAITTYYAMLYRLGLVSFPQECKYTILPKSKKWKAYIKEFDKSLNTMADRIGSEDDMRELVRDI